MEYTIPEDEFLDNQQFDLLIGAMEEVMERATPEAVLELRKHHLMKQPFFQVITENAPALVQSYFDEHMKAKIQEELRVDRIKIQGILHKLRLMRTHL